MTQMNIAVKMHDKRNATRQKQNTKPHGPLSWKWPSFGGCSYRHTYRTDEARHGWSRCAIKNFQTPVIIWYSFKFYIYTYSTICLYYQFRAKGTLIVLTSLIQQRQ